MRKIISLKKIDFCEIEKKVNKLTSKTKDKYKLYDIVCILTMFTTYLLISEDSKEYNKYHITNIRNMIKKVNKE